MIGAPGKDEAMASGQMRLTMRKLLAETRWGTPITYEGLTVVPLLDGAGLAPDWRLLDEASTEGSFAVTEASEAGVVSRLRVVNGGSVSLLLLDGEELVGAKQNRILNTTVLIAAGRTADIPVSCVEQGRWSCRGGRFAPSGRSVYASVRRSKSVQVHAALRAEGRHVSDQGRIWNDLADMAVAFRVSSPTGAMYDAYESRAETLAAYRRQLGPVDGQVGAVVYGASGWLGVDLLPSPALFDRAWARLLSGYSMEALRLEGPARVLPEPETLLARLKGARTASFSAVAEGEDWRFRAQGMIGAALVVDGILAHLMAFPAGVNRPTRRRRQGGR
jgi:hypothetical protein